MDLVCSVIVNSCLASYDVCLQRGVTKIKMPHSAVRHYWLRPSVDFQRYREPICISEAPREVGSAGVV